MDSAIDRRRAAAAVRRAVNEEALRLQPVNTARSYGPKQAEFLKWCRRTHRGEQFAEMVTPDKLLMFLQDEVVGRALKKRGRRREEEEEGTDGDEVGVEEADEDEDDQHADMEGQEAADEGIQTTTEQPAVKTVSFGTIDAYVNAISRLWKHQKSVHNSGHSDPRDEHVKQLLNNQRLLENERRESNMEDPAAGTMADGYHTFQELSKITKELLFKGNRKNKDGLRDRAIHLMLHHGMMRFDNVEKLRLGHLFAIKLPYHGFGEDCLALMAIMHAGKTNKTGRKDLTGMLGNGHVEVCPIGALALYFFERST